jgi:hypothetical protein
MRAPDPAYEAGRITELERENETLREQLRQYAAQATVARGAISEATSEKEATARMAHQVAVEERATRAAVETQSSSLGLSVILQIITFFLVLIVAFGLFVWLPREVEARSGKTVITPGGVTTVQPR